MSVSQFTPILRQKIIEIFSDSSNKVDLANFGSKTRKQLFKEAPDTKNLRTRFESKDFHTSSVTIDGMSALTSRLLTVVEDGKVKDLLDKVFSNPDFIYNFIAYVEEHESVTEYGAGDYRLEKVPQGNLKKLFIAYINNNVVGIPKSALDTISKNIESGHLAGILFLKLKTALGVQANFSQSPEATYRDFTISMPGVEDENAIKALDSVLKAVIDADYLTSNLVTNHEVFIDATKSVLGDKPMMITEMQFKVDNKAAGDLLQQTGRQLNILIKAASAREQSATESAISDLIKTLKPLSAAILQKAEELKAPLSEQKIYDKIVSNANYLVDVLINTPGSPTLKDGIGKNIANIIKTGKSLNPVVTKIKPKPILQKQKETINIKQVVKEFEKATKELKSAIKKNKISSNIRNKSGLKTTRGQFYSLVKLQDLINSMISQKVKENMGSGDRRDILNLRSGRFAESVKVERLSQSREGMITAFYTYMKNPYATFSEGGKQQYPKSRDPKLLIAKSIREIAATKVANRLRAVVI